MTKDHLLFSIKSEIDKIQIPDNYNRMSNQVLMVKLHDDIRLIEQQMRYGQHDDAMKTAAEIAVKMAIYASKERI